MSLASRSANAEHLAQELKSAAAGLPPESSDAVARSVAIVMAELDHRLRAEVDEALGRLEARIEQELRELAEAEQ
jgi:hypothetical protein